MMLETHPTSLFLYNRTLTEKHSSRHYHTFAHLVEEYNDET